MHEVDAILGGILILPATPDVIAGFIAEAEAAPEELSTIANVMSAPPMPFIPAEHHGKIIMMAMLAYVGAGEAGERAIAPFRALAEPIADMLRPMRYPEMFPPEADDYHPTAVGRTMFLDRIDHNIAETIIETLRASDASLRVAQLRVLGGAMARVSVEATAFAHRKSRIMANVAAFYDGPEDQAVRGPGRGLRGCAAPGRLRCVCEFPGRRGSCASARCLSRRDMGPTGGDQDPLRSDQPLPSESQYPTSDGGLQAVKSGKGSLLQ
jgi:hypothetical protein